MKDVHTHSFIFGSYKNVRVSQAEIPSEYTLYSIDLRSIYLVSFMVVGMPKQTPICKEIKISETYRKWYKGNHKIMHGIMVEKSRKTLNLI